MENKELKDKLDSKEFKDIFVEEPKQRKVILGWMSEGALKIWNDALKAECERLNLNIQEQ